MKNIMYKLKILTESLETQNLSLVDAAHLIDTSIKSLEDINSDIPTLWTTLLRVHLYLL